MELIPKKEAIKAVPTNWLDPLLSHPKTGIPLPASGGDVENLLRGLRDKIAAIKPVKPKSATVAKIRQTVGIKRNELNTLWEALTLSLALCERDRRTVKTARKIVEKLTNKMDLEGGV
jgi:hypothetical protein